MFGLLLVFAVALLRIIIVVTLKAQKQKQKKMLYDYFLHKQWDLNCNGKLWN